MKQQRQFPTVTVTKKAQRSLQEGHPWVYGGEVIEVKETADGQLCDVVNEKGTYLGTGFYNAACGLFRRTPTMGSTKRSGAAGSGTAWITAGLSWARISAAAG